MITNAEVRTKVLDIIADIALDDDVTVIKDDVALREQLDLDSMDFLDIVMELKKRHKIEVPQEDYSKLASMKSCVEYQALSLMPKKNNYDCIIIGAGMSGLAAGIRLSMFQKKVIILEKHSIPGGLNSYYTRGNRKFDVGLHALTNFVSAADRGKPFNKLMKQLRIPYDNFKLSPQNYSLIKFPDCELKFNNEIEYLTDEIRKTFPKEIDGFMKLLEHIMAFNEVNLNNNVVMAKDVVRSFISDKTLVEMIFCPLLIYGSAWENDMDFSQFVVMFKSIFLEGFSRPAGGVRTILDLLTKKYQGEIRYKAEVTKIITKENKIIGVEINNTEVLYADKILSSIGLPETFDKINCDSKFPTGNLSFTESILITDKKTKDLGVDATIIFLNDRPEYLYQRPHTFIDSKSAVACFPNNFLYKNYNDDSTEGVMRVTNIANYEMWAALSKQEYADQKDVVYQTTKNILKSCGILSQYEVLYKDIFTPITVKKYTGHFNGTVYGSTEKSRNGKTPIDGLFVCGTDQGFLGIVGAMLSGISMANLHILTSEIP